MKKNQSDLTNQFSHSEGKTVAERSADLVQLALARNAEQLAAQRQVVASSISDWDRLMAEAKLSQLEIDGRILGGEIPGESQFLISRERARRMTIEWDFDALMKTKLK